VFVRFAPSPAKRERACFPGKVVFVSRETRVRAVCGASGDLVEFCADVPKMGTMRYTTTMRVISRKRLKDFWGTSQGKGSEGFLRAWFAEAALADWKSPHDVRRQYATSSVLKGGRVVFNIGGNRFRLVVAIRYDLHIVYIRFVGTHRQYDCVDAEVV
jgi:mRNA interferase HigB